MYTKWSVVKLQLLIVVYFLYLSINKPSAIIQMISVLLKTHSDTIYRIL